MEIIEFKWKIPNNIFKNQDIKSRIIKQIAERTIKTLENKSALSYFENDQLLIVSFPIEKINSPKVLLTYNEIENLLSFYNLIPFVRLNRNIDSTWDIIV